jgi:2-hydroxy-3-keto-5-methylthiopentenyl-1-phosphate phosphatase
MLAVQRASGPVAFVGEGHSDRYGALYADIVFAKDVLVDLCRDDGIPFVPYEDFDDVRATLEVVQTLPGAVAPDLCPGWHTA